MSMEIGLMWFDNDPKRDMETKIRQAAARYLAKHGQPANICYVHPNMLKAEKAPEMDGLEIRSNRYILHNHFWIGRREEKIPFQQLVLGDYLLESTKDGEK
jgi:hypothetical protein